jgi:hypothetical protein
MEAFCIRCRGALNDEGFCPSCSAEGAASQEPREPAPFEARASDLGIRSHELDVADDDRARRAIEELLEHRRRGRGRIIGIAGLPRHGKTTFADRLREKAAERPGVDRRYDKTERGRVNIYYIPGRRQHHVLIDVAGEDFQALGDYGREVPALVRSFLWPVLQKLDGLVLMAALPIVWGGWNSPTEEARRSPQPGEEEEMQRACRRLVDAHRTLLKYAMVAADLRRLRRRFPRLELDAARAPTRTQVDDAFQAAEPLRAPVAIAFSKADLYACGPRPGLHAPPLPGMSASAALDPLDADPLVLGWRWFPDLFEFLMQRVRYFKFDFVQALEDRSPAPNPNVAAASADAGIGMLLGAEAILEYLTAHPWRFPSLSTATAIRLDQRLHPLRWAGPAAAPATGA